LLGAAAPTTSTTLRIKGEVKTGNQQTAVNASGFSVLGNPYPSAINFATLTRNNVKNSFYIWDPQLGGTYGLGGYVTVSYNSGTGTYDVTSAASPISQYIPSGEAILVESLDGATPGTITVKESDKTTNGSDMLFRSTGQAGSSLRIKLLADNPQAESDLIDGTLISFHEKFNNGLDQEDVTKMKGSAESISIACRGKELAIERRLGVSSTDTTFIQMDQLKKQVNYAIEFEAIALPDNVLSAIIIDLYQKESKPTALNLSGLTRMAFSTTQQAASVSPNRFVIVYTVKPGAPAVATSSDKVRPVTTIETPAVSVYPNPVVGNQVQLSLQNMKVGTYTIAVYSLTGQRLTQQTVQYNNLGSPVRIVLPEGITAGQYELQVIGNGKTKTTTLIKQ
ncbi:MAG: T9SS type A sorting domain-containing protein, partial [Ferruginibacter sp.]